VSDTIETLIDRLTERQRLEFALACARRVQHIMTDPRSVAALDTRERWLRGKAAAAARNAAAAARAARDAAAAARAARDAAWAAARAAAWAEADAAAACAAWDAERAWQRAELERMLKEGGGS
jgi:hypothetical protein